MLSGFCIVCSKGEEGMIGEWAVCDCVGCIPETLWSVNSHWGEAGLRDALCLSTTLQFLVLGRPVAKPSCDAYRIGCFLCASIEYWCVKWEMLNFLSHLSILFLIFRTLWSMPSFESYRCNEILFSVQLFASIWPESTCCILNPFFFIEITEDWCNWKHYQIF